MKCMIEPPSRTQVQDAIELLEKVGALVPENQTLTPLGVTLAQIPLHPQLGKMVLIATFFRCLNPILSIVSVLDQKDPFLLEKSSKKQELDKIKSQFAQGQPSDHLMFANIIYQWEKAFDSGTNIQFCTNNKLNEKNLYEIYQIKQQLMQRLEKIDILGNVEDLDQNSNNLQLIKAVLAYGLYPLVKRTKIERNNRFSFLEGDDENRIYINPRSVNASQLLREPFVAYFNARGNKKGNLSVSDCTNLDENLVNLFDSKGLNYDIIPSFSSSKPSKIAIRTYINDCLTKKQKASASNPTVVKVINYIQKTTPIHLRMDRMQLD